jgi:Domain of unknown function (DUF4385)
MSLAYLKAGDFPRCRHGPQFLQMGWTRPRRYTDHRGGRKYDWKTGEQLPRSEDTEKASAAAFYERYGAARQDPEFVRQKELHRERYEGRDFGLIDRRIRRVNSRLDALCTLVTIDSGTVIPS